MKETPMLDSEGNTAVLLPQKGRKESSHGSFCRSHARCLRRLHVFACKRAKKHQVSRLVCLQEVQNIILTSGRHVSIRPRKRTLL